MEQERPLSRFGTILTNNLGAKIGEIAGLFIIATIYISALLPLTGGDPIYSAAVVWTGNIIMITLVWLGLRARNQTWAHFGLDPENLKGKKLLNTFLWSLVVLLVGGGLFLASGAILMSMVDAPEQLDLSNLSYFEGNLPLFIATLLGVFIASSFGEELVYRAFIIKRVSEMFEKERTGKMVGLIVCTVMFGLVHASWGPIGIVQTAFMGLGFGLMYLRLPKNLWALVFAHAYMDAVLIIQMYLG